MANKHTKRWSASLAIREMKNHKYHEIMLTHLSEWLKEKAEMTPDADEDTENVKCYSHCGTECGSFNLSKHALSIQASNRSLGPLPQRNEKVCPCRNLGTNVPSRLIPQSPTQPRCASEG